jgi:pimeloyl-ACP methyl ester carboxylesterase/DNA-binding CsgD family transcriptional regulator
VGQLEEQRGFDNLFGDGRKRVIELDGMNQFRQQIRFCTRPGGARVAYAVSGKGFPILKVANWVNHLEYDLKNPVWRHWIAELSRDHMLVRYDESGCGLSDWNVPDLSFDAWVQDLESVADAASLARFALLGISQGAAIAIAYAVRHPQRVSHLVLHGAYARGRLKRAVTAQQREEAQAAVKLAETGWGKDNAATRQFFTTQFIPEATLEQHRSWNEYERMATTPANAARFMQAFDQIDVTAVAPDVHCPSLVLHARGDERVPFEEGRRVAGLIPGAQFVPLESGNHLLLEEEPAWRQWLERVRAFLPLAPGGAFSALTSRERELLELIAQGLDNAQLAAHLRVSEKTVRNHITSIFAKLEVKSRAQAIVLARDAGFGRTPPHAA